MRHLSHEEITAAVADLDLQPESRRHLRDCLSCRASIHRMTTLIAERREAMLRELPDWNEQSRQILDRLPDQDAKPGNRWLQPLLAMAACLVLVLGIASLRGIETRETVETASADIELEEVLAETESLLEDDSIPGLWVADPVSDIDDIETLFAKDAS